MLRFHVIVNVLMQKINLRTYCLMYIISKFSMRPFNYFSNPIKETPVTAHPLTCRHAHRSVLSFLHLYCPAMPQPEAYFITTTEGALMTPQTGKRKHLRQTTARITGTGSPTWPTHSPATRVMSCSWRPSTLPSHVHSPLHAATHTYR